MTVYVVYRDCGYEGCPPLHVFKTREGAEAYIASASKIRSRLDYEELEVEE